VALLELRDVTKAYRVGRRDVLAVRGVDLDVAAGETVALVGESGCGKSSLARVVAGLTSASGGTVRFDGQEMSATPDAALRSRVQMVFQHPRQSLNGRFRIQTTLDEPAKLLTELGAKERRSRITDTLRLVGLDPALAGRRPGELSGGQQQRVAIARALMCQPDLIVLDEPTSSLDQSVRGRILALLKLIQRERGVSYLFISHDLSTVRRVAHRVAVMYLGRIVELADTETLFDSPQHPYTQSLLSAAPNLDPRARSARVRLPGETPSGSDLPLGCAFQQRCSLVHDRCRHEAPTSELSEDSHLVECFAVTAATPARR
jgi:oligopeptide/dipeptide ABC transporter ATP-binding protein